MAHDRSAGPRAQQLRGPHVRHAHAGGVGRADRERFTRLLHGRRTGLDDGPGAVGGQEAAPARLPTPPRKRERRGPRLRQEVTAAKRRILLIDDTPQIAELLTFALRDHGYEVVATGYTDTVNEWVVQSCADALVLECSVFDMSESLFDMVRNDPAHADLPIVIISDTPEEADASLRSRQADRVLLIPKPFTGAQVARALDQLLAA
ncbi:MAG: response regulator [Acidobacteria bacterium]|nr:response regulator [Acidobacteriota bacterium]